MRRHPAPEGQAGLSSVDGGQAKASAAAAGTEENADPAAQELSRMILARVHDVPDFPTPGVLFKDLTPLLADGPALRAVLDALAGRYAGRTDAVAGIEARGFVLGAGIAYALGIGFVPVRKAGKLPGATHRAEYALEYGNAVLEIPVDAFPGGHRVLVVDDVLATGGTAAAACRVVELAGGTVLAVATVLELSALRGRRALPGRDVHTLATG